MTPQLLFLIAVGIASSALFGYEQGWRRERFVVGGILPLDLVVGVLLLAFAAIASAFGAQWWPVLLAVALGALGNLSHAISVSIGGRRFVKDLEGYRDRISAAELFLKSLDEKQAAIVLGLYDTVRHKWERGGVLNVAQSDVVVRCVVGTVAPHELERISGSVTDKQLEQMRQVLSEDQIIMFSVFAQLKSAAGKGHSV